jgi:hypothetical protein
MTGHFYKNLNLHDLILTRRPKVILEVGAHLGDCTRVLASMRPVVPCQLWVISDRFISVVCDQFWEAISYKKIAELPDDSIGMAIVDTDHNYWTLEQELLALVPKMEEGGLIVMHDVEEFYYDTGMANAYWNKDPYPKQEILGAHTKGGLGLCVIDFLHAYRGNFKLVKWVPEHFGCAVIEKRTVTETRIISPGSGSVVAPPQ